MVAANEYRASLGYSQAYSEDSLAEQADIMANLARKLETEI